MSDARSPVLDPATVEPYSGSSYPAPFNLAAAGREKRFLGPALGLTQFGVNLARLPPGAWSSQRHWHALEDEFIYVLEGELVLVTDAGEQVLRAGMAAGFPAGRPDGHHLINRSNREALYLEVGTDSPKDMAVYSDIDMEMRPLPEGGHHYVHRDGTPY
ncbi:cupin domain-containing protein [Chondromyces apiculatus]|uniref:cupin domain-containing protein n=1 Tax=Chondromyces apiculatus TaxID=51 RepID=UPI0005C59D46|nr:cupin domain-containing protein [Chondromyces apiculatus]